MLEASAEEGVTFYDTADVYGDGRSEQVVGAFLADHADDGFFVATKMGRRVDQVPENYNPANFRTWTDRSRRNLGVDRLDLVQLHCPPSATIDDDATYDALDALVEDGTIAAYGVSVETVDQALSAMTRPNLASVQIILNALRLKPLEKVLPTAIETATGIIARVPLASGLLSGKYDASTTFADGRPPQLQPRRQRLRRRRDLLRACPSTSGCEAAADFGRLVEESGPDGLTSAQAAIAWVSQLPGVTTVIPGARSERQARSNAAAGRAPALGDDFLAGVGRIYDERVRELVHDRW